MTLGSLYLLLHVILGNYDFCEVRIQTQLESIKFKREGSAKEGYLFSLLSFNVNYSSNF